MLRDFCYKLQANVIRCFRGYNFAWHLLAIVLTYLLVTSGFDWWYFESTRGAWIHALGMPASLIGGLLPVLFPVGLYIFGRVRKSVTLKNTAAALGQAVIIASFISSLYKAFTGRLHPALWGQLPYTDISRIFHFGFLQSGIFWGWPSSHTTIAFAMSAALVALYPRRYEISLPAALYALYIGLGVSVTIHWFSDFVAGAIIGTVIGLVVSRSYRKRDSATPREKD